MNMQKGNSAVVVILVLAVAVAAGAAIFFLTGNDEDTVVSETTAPVNETQNKIEANETVDNSENDDVGDLSNDAEDMEPVVIDLTGENFSFSQEEIRVQEGQEVTINLTSTEGIHDWMVEEYNVGTEQIAAGETTSVTFVADQEGEFEYYCSVGDHRQMGMVGTLIVE